MQIIGKFSRPYAPLEAQIREHGIITAEMSKPTQRIADMSVRTMRYHEGVHEHSAQGAVSMIGGLHARNARSSSLPRFAPSRNTRDNRYRRLYIHVVAIHAGARQRGSHKNLHRPKRRSVDSLCARNALRMD